jgi:hypothetical protein
VVFGAFAIWTFPPSAVFMLPAVVLITVLNLRDTRFCDQCGTVTQVTLSADGLLSALRSPAAGQLTGWLA